jgi:hypothetical protein
VDPQITVADQTSRSVAGPRVRASRRRDSNKVSGSVHLSRSILLRQVLQKVILLTFGNPTICKLRPEVV